MLKTTKKQQLSQEDKSPTTIKYNVASTILHDINLPDTIKTAKKETVVYSPTLAISIVTAIASDGSRTIEQICQQHNITLPQLHVWMLYSDPLRQAYHRAKELRQDVKIDHIESMETDLDAILDNPDMDTREKGLRVQRHRINVLSRQWEAARLNKRYQDKSQTDVTVNDAAALRAQAWEMYQQSQQPQATECTDVSNNSNNDQP